MQENRLELIELSKRYPAVLANDKVNLQVKKGEIHAILGENGAGKSTMMKMIYGATQPTSGTIKWEGKIVTIASPAMARKLGIGMVYQHFSLFETLTVIENIALALDEKFDLKSLSTRVIEVSEKYGLPVEPHRLVHTLSVGERQRIEIVRCLLQNPKLLIMDEPTSVLTPQAVRKLFETLRQLKDEGCSILYISHKLEEIRELCDTATILRGGRVTGDADPKQCTANELAQMMIGRSLTSPDRRVSQVGEDVLQVRNLSWLSDDPFGTSIKDISFDLKAGQILGIAGVSGNGQQELMALLSGETLSNKSDAIVMHGKAIGKYNPEKRRQLGLCFVPEERLGRGAVPDMALNDNALLTAHRQGYIKNGIINHPAIDTFTKDIIKDFDVRCGGSTVLARSLSGGNLQKFIVGREIKQAPKVLLVMQPTWGVDVGAARFIRQQLIDMAATGVAVLVVSEELEELFEICDDLCVLAEGQLSSARPVGETNSEEIGLLMAGSFLTKKKIAA